MEGNNNINQSRIPYFRKSTEANNPTDDSGAMSLPQLGNSFMYIDTSYNNRGHERVFVSWERTDILQITNRTFYYNG